MLMDTSARQQTQTANTNSKYKQQTLPNNNPEMMSKFLAIKNKLNTRIIYSPNPDKITNEWDRDGGGVIQN